MVRVTDRNDAHTGGLSLLDGHFHSLVGNQLTHGVMSVDNGGDGGLENNLGLGVDLNHTLLNALVVTNHTLHTMGLDAEQVRSQQDILNDVSFLLVEAELGESIHAEAMQGIIGPILVSHKTFLTFHFITF